MKNIYKEEYVDPFGGSFDGDGSGSSEGGVVGDFAIRAEHYMRYVWAARKIGSHEVVVWDVGCGAGYGGKILQAMCPHITYIGLDGNEHMLKDARQKVSGTFVQVDFEKSGLQVSKNMPKPHIIICFETLEHLENPQKVVKDMFKLGVGKVFASVPQKKFEPKKRGKSRNPHHKQLFTQEDFRNLFTQAGFESIKLYGQFTNKLMHKARPLYRVLNWLSRYRRMFNMLAPLCATPVKEAISFSYSMIAEVE